MLDLQEKVNELTVTIDNILQFNAPQRVVCTLKKLSSGNDSFTLPLTKTTIALQVGIELETLSRSLKKLPLYGAEVSGKRVVLDRGHTRRAVCNGCAARYWCKSY